MGIKGDKNTSEASQTADLLLSKLEVLNDISAKKMFGGYGIFKKGKMFGMVDSKGQTYFKADENSSVFFTEKGSEKHSKMPYYLIPSAVIEEYDVLLEWANVGIKSALKQG